MPTTEPRSAFGDSGERHQQARRVEQRHAEREHDRRDDEARERAPQTHETETNAADEECERRGPRAAQAVRKSRAHDAHCEDDAAVEQEDRLRAASPQLFHVQREELGVAGQADEAEHQHDARRERGPVEQLGPRSGGGVEASDIVREPPEHRRDERQRRGDEPGVDVVMVAQHQLSERGAECKAAVHRDRPVAHGFAASRLGREVGDHRGRTDEERGLAHTGRDTRADEERYRRDQPVTRGRNRDDSRPADDQHTPADTVTDATGERS